MKNIIAVITNGAHWDSGQPDTYTGVKWNFVTMTPEYISFGTSRPNIDAHAPPLAIECYSIWSHNKNVDSQRRVLELDTANPERAVIGDTIRVVAGALAPRGTIGDIVRIINSNYGVQFMIRDNKNEYRVYAKNVEVLAVQLSHFSHRSQYRAYPIVSELEKLIYS